MRVLNCSDLRDSSRLWRVLEAKRTTITMSTIAPNIKTPFCCSIAVRSVVSRIVLACCDCVLVVISDSSIDVALVDALLLAALLVDDAEEVKARVLLVVAVVAAIVIGTASHGSQVEPLHALW